MSVTVASIETFAVAVPFKHSFVLGSGRAGDPQHPGDVLFVKITASDGTVGWGEQRAVPSWSYETIETIDLVIRRHLAPLLIGQDPLRIEEFHRRADAKLSPSVSNGFPFARAALDVGLHDLVGRLCGLPVHALLGGKITDSIPLCSAVGVAAPEEVSGRVQESSAYHAFKIKISGHVDADVAAVRAAADHAGGKPIWLDANQSYRPSAVRMLLDRIHDVPNLYCLEQPVPSVDWASMARLRGQINIPLAIDEGCFTAPDLARTAVLGAADMVVIKVCKSGGLRQLLKSAAVARAHGLEVLSSGLTDCGIGFAAALHAFSVMDLSLPAELNGPELLPDLYVDGLTITDAVAAVPDGPGLGIDVDEDRIRVEARSLG